MKSKLAAAVHHFFRFPLFEKGLLLFSKNSFIGSATSKLVPPNFTYPNPTYRVARQLGYKINVNLNDYNDWKTYWGLKEEEREELYKLAASARTVVDIGVNNGWVMINLANIIKKNSGHVYGFEPHPETFKRSFANISTNNISNATLYNLGCGDSVAEMKMVNVISTNSGQNRIVQDNALHSTKEVTVVKIVTLDEQLKDVGKIDLVKIDVEGFEKKVLQGAINILKRDKPVLFIELDDMLLKSNDSSGFDLIAFLQQYGYNITHARTGKEVKRLEDVENYHFDIICK